MDRIELEQELLKEGYSNLRWLKWGEKEVLCGTYPFIFTHGLVINIDAVGYEGRFCFKSTVEAVMTLFNLSELPIDLHDMPGEWIKYKGGEQFSNKNLDSTY